MIERLRPKYSEEDLKKIYSVPHEHEKWLDHKVRVESTVALARVFTGNADVSISSIGDLSCGDAVIPNRIAEQIKEGVVNLRLGDFAPKYEYCGPIESTIDLVPHVDLFVLSETVEHLDDPELVLRKIRDKSSRLIVSTPLSEELYNPQHYWRWDKEGFSSLLVSAGWNLVAYQELTFNYLNGYGYQIYAAQ